MLLFIVQQIILSFILIAVVHYIYEYFKNNLTEPKIKDLVNKPQAKYEQIYKSIPQESQSPSATSYDMKMELQNYLSELSDNKKSKPSGESVLENNIFENNYQSL